MLRLYKNYKYDSTYEYIKFFKNENEQLNYFNSLEYEEIEKDYYIRTNTNKFTIDKSIEELEVEEYNYLSYSNEGKIYYCFITNLEYNSQFRTNIIFEVDVIQTFMFDFTIDKSFIERKVCSINEVSDFDEGLNIGEHIIESDTVMLNKNCEYFALFNGIREQLPIYNDDGVMTSVVDLPYSTSKPTTKINGVLYPLYFMPLSQTFTEGDYMEIENSAGSNVRGNISAKLLRFLKGYEAFASMPYYDSGGILTIGYGITKASGYWDKLYPVCTEEQASKVKAESIQNSYCKSVINALESNGVDIKSVKQNHLDAFVSLCYNCGIGGVTSSPMFAKYIANQNDTTASSGWESWYINDNFGNELEGLKLRRQAEKNIFDNGVYEYRPIPIVNSNAEIVGTVTANNGNGYIPTNVNGGV